MKRSRQMFFFCSFCALDVETQILTFLFLFLFFFFVNYDAATAVACTFHF